MKKTAIVFGVGGIFFRIREFVLRDYNIVAFVDNNKAKICSLIDGIPILTPSQVIGLDYDVVIIAAFHIEDIARQLNELGAPSSKVKLGINYILDDLLTDEPAKVSYFLDEGGHLSCKTSTVDSGFVSIKTTDGKDALIDAKSIPAIISIKDGLDSPENFFRLSEKFYGDKTGIFIDVGANVGTTSMKAAEFRRVTECLAFEPSRKTYSFLMANVYLNKLEEKIHGHRYAVGEKEGFVELWESPLCSSDNRIRENPDKLHFNYSNFDPSVQVPERVPVVSLDAFMAGRYDQIGFLWVDAQGYEFFILKGCENILKTVKVPVKIEYWPTGIAETGSLDLLNEFLVSNFRGYIDLKEVREDEIVVRDILEIRDLSRRLLDDKSYTDVFLIQDGI